MRQTDICQEFVLFADLKREKTIKGLKMDRLEEYFKQQGVKRNVIKDYKKKVGLKEWEKLSKELNRMEENKIE